jgi:hypothetical protein
VGGYLLPPTLEEKEGKRGKKREREGKRGKEKEREGKRPETTGKGRGREDILLLPPTSYTTIK